MRSEEKYCIVGARRGFSLIELLITTALILTMFVMTYGSRTKSRDLRQMQQCSRNLQSVFVALDIYANEHGGAFPVVTNADVHHAIAAISPVASDLNAIAEVSTRPQCHQRDTTRQPAFQRSKSSSRKKIVLGDGFR